MKYSKIQLNKMMKKNFTVSSTSSFKGKTSVLKVIVNLAIKKFSDIFTDFLNFRNFREKENPPLFYP